MYWARLMIRRRFRWLILTTLLLFTLGQTIACSHRSVPVAQATCHPVQHFAGTTCVPDKIERLVALDTASFEYALALGLQPIGTVIAEGVSSHLQDKVTNVEDIGQAGEPNLERVLSLKPDLIIGLNYHQAIYTHASQIAPTVLLKFEHSGEWKEVFRQFSITLNRETIGKQVLQQYDRRLQEFQKRLRETLASNSLSAPPKVSVVRIYPDKINLYLRDSFPGTVLQDAGLARPTAQNVTATRAKQLFNNQIQVSISVERLDQADGDVIFVWTSENTVQANETAQKKLAELQTNALWKRLNAVKKDRVYFVPNYWIGSGPIAANAMLNDLYKYLIQTPTS
jgi:iron complex transport system substrate-binding protein